MRWPREELSHRPPAAPLAAYDRLQVKGAVFGSKLNWSAPIIFFRPEPRNRRRRSARGLAAYVLEEQRACREDVVVFDQTSFAKLVLKGRDALAVLQRLCANEIDVPVGRMVYTAMLNERGGFESDLTITRLGADAFFILTGSAQATRDADWIERHIGEGEFAALVDVTSAYSLLSVMGPKAEALLGRLSPDDLSKAGMPFSTTRETDVGHARVRAARMSYVGGPGYELTVLSDLCLTLYDALGSAGAEFGLKDAGYYTIDALRIEAGRRAWGAELGPDETPWEAGLGYAVKLDKPAAFIGREACAAEGGRAAQAARTLHLRRSAAFPWGGEPISGRQEVGELTSAGYSRKHGRAVAMGYARAERILTDDALLAAKFEVDIAGELFAVTPRLKLG